MKIVRIIARLNVGGPARHVVWLTAGLTREGHETVLVTGVVPEGEGDMFYLAERAGLRPVVIPHMSREISLKDVLVIWHLYRLFLRERPDLIHTHTAKAGTVGRIAGFFYRWLTPSALWGRPRRCLFVHTYHGHIFHSYYGPLKTRLFLYIERALARLVTDRIVVISEQQYREIHEEFKVGRAAQFEIIPLGMNVEEFGNWSSNRRFLREELKAGAEDVLVGIVGRLTEIKNHSLFLRVAALYKQTRGLRREGGGRIRFIIVGDGNLRAALQEEARNLELQEDVSFLGMRDDPALFYPALDVVALTSRNEGTPLTLIEAMANERAVVSTGVGGVVDLLGEATEGTGDGIERRGFQLCERGVLVRPGDAEAFCEGLARLVEDAELRRKLGTRGRVFVVQNYSRERLMKDISNLYRELAEQKAESGVLSLEA